MKVIFTVETGEYSDHHIWGFCASLAHAQAIAATVVQRYEDDFDDERGSLGPLSQRWPRVYSNPVGELIGHGFAEPSRVKWCDKDDAI